jgi:hypothetical protein
MPVVTLKKAWWTGGCSDLQRSQVAVDPDPGSSVNVYLQYVDAEGVLRVRSPAHYA